MHKNYFNCHIHKCTFTHKTHPHPTLSIEATAISISIEKKKLFMVNVNWLISQECFYLITTITPSPSSLYWSIYSIDRTEIIDYYFFSSIISSDHSQLLFWLHCFGLAVFRETFVIGRLVLVRDTAVTHAFI